MIFYFLQFSISSKFAVLYGGSNMWDNYRHQADIYTMYDILIKNGFKENEIITFAYDDIAENKMNYEKGKVFHNLDHINVYPGSLHLNFKEKSITAQKFYDTLTSLPTTSDDYVFIYYNNHGSEDYLHVPTGNGDPISGEELAATFNTMEEKKLYKYCFFAIEACYSGSVAEQFTAKNLITITAANANETSNADNWDDDLTVWLSNQFSNSLMNEIIEHNNEAIGDLFKHVSQYTTGSTVSYYGNESLKFLLLSDFVGTPQKNSTSKSKSTSKLDLIPKNKSSSYKSKPLYPKYKKII